MNGSTAIIISGIAMIIGGFVAFYGFQGSLDSLSTAIRHGGTFVGLMGIGVVIAGVLLYLVNRPQQNSVNVDLN